jgi:hypothetical protein
MFCRGQEAGAHGVGHRVPHDDADERERAMQEGTQSRRAVRSALLEEQVKEKRKMWTKRRIPRCKYRAKIGTKVYGKYATWAEAQGRCNKLTAEGKGSCKVVKRPRPCTFRRGDKRMIKR